MSSSPMKSSSIQRALLLVLLSVFAVAFMLHVPYAGAAAPQVPSRQADGVRWGFYITYNPNSWTSLQANVSNLNYVSPWFYNLDASGQVTGKDQPQVSSLLRQAGAKSLPMIKNTPQYDSFTAILTDTNKQISIINQLDNLITANSYSGVTIDFEGLNAGDKTLLTSFMERLYARLHPKGKLVAIAVAPKIKEITSGWAAAYDYTALAPNVDYLLVMAYDYHWVNSDPGPIAPMPKLRATADYTVAHIVPSKVVWGTGVYGLDWGHGDGKPAEYRSWPEADAIAHLPDAQGGYDGPSESPYVQYTRDGVQREVWYENRRSFEAKLDLIGEYGMAGFGIWRLGQEDPAVWESIRQGAPPKACKRVDVSDTPAGQTYFSATGHTLGGPFLSYWRAHGGLPVFGYPLTEEFTETSATNGKPYTVQYFERNRFEYHPENKPPNDVLLGLLGVQLTKGRAFPQLTDPSVGVDTLFFPQVRHTLGGSFLTYWQTNGGLSLFGFPISEPVLENSDVDGRTYMVQYMERARFEYHSEYKGTRAEVLLGLLGLNVLPCR